MKTTLRTRLLIGIFATIIVTLSLTQYGLYVLVRRQLYAEFDQNLGAKARAMAVMIEQTGDEVDIEFQEHPMQEYARSVRPEYYQVWSKTGQSLARSRQLVTSDLEQVPGDMGVPSVQSTLLPDGRQGRVASIRFRPRLDEFFEYWQRALDVISFRPRVERETLGIPSPAARKDDDAEDREPVDFSNGFFVTLAVARDTLEIEQSLAGLTWLLFGSGLVSATAILGTLAWLVTRNLKPIHSLAQQIEDVNEKSLEQRFELADAPGELQPVVARLNGLMNRLEDAFRREKTFTADVAHELRTPLAGIRATLEVGLSRKRLTENYVDSMKCCLRISEETETIIATLLSLARMEAGHATLENDVVDVGALLRKLWQPFATRATMNETEVIWDCSDAMLVETDHGKLSVVLSNLLDNATSYVEENGTITIESWCAEDTVKFRISNTGCRLSTEQVRNVFDRFWRADDSRSGTGSHSGLGLALTQRIVEFLNGTVHADVIDNCFVATVTLNASRIDLAADSTEDEELPSEKERPDRLVLAGQS